VRFDLDLPEKSRSMWNIADAVLRGARRRREQPPPAVDQQRRTEPLSEARPKTRRGAALRKNGQPSKSLAA